MPVTIPVPITPEEQVALQAQAEAEGVSVDVLLHRAVQHVLAGNVDAQQSQRELSGEALEKAFQEMADLVPESVPSIPDDALSRENIYTREDEW